MDRMTAKPADQVRSADQSLEEIPFNPLRGEYKKTFTTMALRVGRYLAEMDAGRLRLDDWVLAEDGEYPTDDCSGGKHHMAPGRQPRPRDGVVDKDCRLLIAGSSVFRRGPEQPDRADRAAIAPPGRFPDPGSGRSCWTLRGING